MITFLFLCLSSSFLSFLWPPQILKKISMYIQEQNEKIYAPRGLILTDPIERGMRVVSFANSPGWFSALRYAFLNRWHHHKLWTLMTYPVCLLKRLCSFSCHLKLRYFPLDMFSFQFWLTQKKNRKMVYIWFGTAWCQSTLLWLCVFYSFQSRKSHFHKSHVLYKEYHFTFSRSAEVTVWYVDIKQRGKSALFVGVSFHFPAWLGNCVRPKSAWGQTWLETLCLCD